MTVIVPQIGEFTALQALLNAQNTVLRLYINNIVPSETSVASTFVECSGSGYVAPTLVSANWAFAAGTPYTATYGTQNFLFTGALPSQATIYGYFVTQATSGNLLWAEAITPFTPLLNGDTLAITPNLTCD